MSWPPKGRIIQVFQRIELEKISYRKGETICNFKYAANIQSKKLASNKCRRKLLAVFDYLQDSLYRKYIQTENYYYPETVTLIDKQDQIDINKKKISVPINDFYTQTCGF